jgi:hypothetical protein
MIQAYGALSAKVIDISPDVLQGAARRRNTGCG